MKKRIILKLILFFMMWMIMFGAITGCGGNVHVDEDDTEQLKSDSLKETTLTFYFLGKEKTNSKEVLEKIESQTKDTLNVKLDFKWIYTDYQNVIFKLLTSSGVEPIDVFCSRIRFDYQYISYNLLKDIKDLLPKYAPNLFKQYNNGDIQSVTFSGQTSFLPILYPLTNAVYAVVREDLMKKYSIPEIKTFDDYESYLNIIHKNEIVTPGAVVTCSNARSIMNLFLPSTNYFTLDSSNGLVCQKIGSDLKITAWEQTAEFKTMVDYLNRWKTGGLINTNSIQADWWNAIYPKFDNGNISSCIVSEKDIGSHLKSLIYNSNKLFQDSNSKNRELKAYQLYPDRKVQIVSPMERNEHIHLAFAKKSENIERTLMFIDWVMSDKKNYDLFMYGIEGRDYIAKTDDTYSLPDGMAIYSSSHLGWQGSEAFRNPKLDRYISGLPNFKSNRDNFIEKHSEFSLNNGFYPDFSKIGDSVITKRMQLLIELENGLLTNKFNLNNVDEAIIELKNSGTDNMVKDIQNQIDKWLGK